MPTVNDITRDIRVYADNAVIQGKQVLDTAQAQVNEYTATANEFVGRTRESLGDLTGKLAGSADDLRQSAEKAINFDALSSAAEPYVAQLREYTSAVTDRVEHVVSSVRSDKRLAALVERAEPVVGVVADLAAQHVVKPVQSYTGWGVPSSPGTPASQASAKTSPSARKPAATKPAAESATKSTATRTATKRVSKPAAESATKSTTESTATRTATKRVSKPTAESATEPTVGRSAPRNAAAKGTSTTN